MVPELRHFSEIRGLVLRHQGVPFHTVYAIAKHKLTLMSMNPIRKEMSCSRKSSRSFSQSFSRSRSRSRDSIDAENPGNNLYVTGLSPRITKDDLEKHFATEGKVVDVRLVLDPWTRESRGFGFVTMARIEDADRCVKYLDQSILEGRVITVEKQDRCQ